MVDSGISSSGFGQAGVGTEFAARGYLAALKFEVVKARLGTLAGEIGVASTGGFVDKWILFFLSSVVNFAIYCHFLIWKMCVIISPGA